MTVRAPKAWRIGLALMLVSTIALLSSCFDSDEVRDETGTGTGTESETGE